MVTFSDDPLVRHRIAFLPDYDIGMARYLYHGCDVWLNNPLRPLEACGTSGMKSALNGGLNLSIRDGWWDEMYDGANGWAIPTAADGIDPEVRDEQEAAALYDLIENQVRSRFYDVDRDRLPRRWLEMVRHTLQSLGPQVLASRMVRDYVVQLYAPAARRRGRWPRMRTPVRASSPPGPLASARRGPACGSATSSRPASPTHQSSASSSRSARSSTSAR